MKKTLLLLVWLTNVLVCHAQIPDLPTITEGADYAFANLDKSNIKTNILYSRGLGVARLDEFTSSDTSSNDHFLQAKLDLFLAHYSNAQHLTPDDLDNIIWTTKQSNATQIGVLLARFQTLNFDAVDLDANGQYFLKNGFTNNDLYLTKDANVVAALQPTIYKGLNYFQLLEGSIFTNQNVDITSITIDFGEGNPLKTITPGVEPVTATYNSAGMKMIYYTVNLSNNTTISAKSTIEVLDAFSPFSFTKAWKGELLTKALLSPIFPYNDGISIVDSARIEADIPFQGYESGDLPIKGKADVITYYAQGRTNLQKPFIVCDGFDPGDLRSGRALYSNKFKYIDGNGDEIRLGDELRLNTANNQYDIVVVNFPRYESNCVVKTICVKEDPENASGLCQREKTILVCSSFDGGADYVQRNAMSLVKIIQNVNAQLQANGSTEKSVLVGPSMGGLITRKALRYMEQNNLNPNVKMWISFDAPHHGANIPIGFQLLVNYFANALKTKDAIDGQKFLSTVAARQMLRSHFLYNTNPPNGGDNELVAGAPNYRNVFQQEMDNIGFPQSTCKNVALNNGSKIGAMTFGACNLGMQIQARLTYTSNLLCRTVSRVLCAIPYGCFIGAPLAVACQIGRNRILNANVYTAPSNEDRCKVMRTEFTNFGWFPNEIFIKGQGANRTSLDILPGGYNEVFSAIKGTSTFFYKMQNNVYFAPASFIPSVSSFALKDINRNWSDPLNTLDIPNETYFSAIYAPDQNEGHVDLTLAGVNFMKNQLLLASSCSGNGSNCPNQLSQTSVIATNQTLSASQSITATNQIINANVTYKAGNNINLNPGFNVNADPSTVFRAYIEGCSNNFWQASLVGNGSGTSNLSNGVLTMKGNGSVPVGGSNDNFIFHHTQTTGDVTIIARINNITAVDGMRAGIMLRTNMKSDSKFYEFILDGNANVGKLKRRNAGGSTEFVGFAPSPTNGTWLKMEKVGNTIKCYVRTDSNPNWEELIGFDDHSDNDLGSPFQIGFVAYNSSNNQSCDVTFDNISVNGVPLN